MSIPEFVMGAVTNDPLKYRFRTKTEEDLVANDGCGLGWRGGDWDMVHPVNNLNTMGVTLAVVVL
jgi:hypothetical protein